MEAGTRQAPGRQAGCDGAAREKEGKGGARGERTAHLSVRVEHCTTLEEYSTVQAYTWPDKRTLGKHEADWRSCFVTKKTKNPIFSFFSPRQPVRVDTPPDGNAFVHRRPSHRSLAAGWLSSQASVWVFPSGSSIQKTHQKIRVRGAARRGGVVATTRKGGGACGELARPGCFRRPARGLGPVFFLKAYALTPH